MPRTAEGVEDRLPLQPIHQKFDRVGALPLSGLDARRRRRALLDGQTCAIAADALHLSPQQRARWSIDLKHREANARRTPVDRQYVGHGLSWVRLWPPAAVRETLGDSSMSHYHAVVWIDHSHATAWHFTSTEQTSAVIRASDQHQRVHSRKSAHGGHKTPGDPRFFEDVALA